MSLDIRSHETDAFGHAAEIEEKLQWVETALLAGGTGVAVVLVSMISVLLHLS